MKSQVSALLHVSQGIIADASAAYPELRGSLSKDFDRLTLIARTRGEGAFTLDLPALEALLLSALESGRLSLDGPLSTAVSPKIQVPRLFSGLWLRVFDKSSCLKHEVDTFAIFLLRSLLTIGKRLEVPCSVDRTSAKVEEYHGIEGKLRRPSYTWDCDSLRLSNPGQDVGHNGPAPYPGDHGHIGHDLRDLNYSFDFGLEEPMVRNKQLDHAKESPTIVQSVDVRLAQAIDYFYPKDYGDSDLFRSKLVGETSVKRMEDKRLLDQIQEVADLIFSAIPEFDPISYSAYLEELGEGIGFRHGPGAVAERLKNHEKSRFPNWPHKLQSIFPFEFCGKTAGSDMERPPSHEVASRLICVPKTAKGPRLIAAEPTSHQWCQQLLLRFLFDQCSALFKGSFIDFKDQQKSGDMVLRASLDRKLATVDLSDASDRLTCWTVERIVRSNMSLLTSLHAARTRYIRDDVRGYTSFLKLKKFASQGTATTFPVMSLVMLCIALGASHGRTQRVTWSSIKKLRNHVRVFGDDIILPRRGYARLVRAMELLELKVNTAKSYVNGHFRESCGTDGYLGECVTPVKPRTLIADSPASCQAVIDTSNNLFNKGLFNAAKAAETLLPHYVRRNTRVVGNNEAGFSGLTSFCGGDERHLRNRWNNRLHRYEVRVWSLQSRIQRSERDGFDAFLDFLSRSESPFNPRVVSEYVTVRKVKANLLWEPQNPYAAGAINF